MIKRFGSDLCTKVSTAVGIDQDGCPTIAPALFTFTPENSSAGGGGGKPGSFEQAGGHDGAFKSKGPELEKSVDEREHSFYEDAMQGKWPASLLPKYHGGTRVGDGKYNICLENLLHGMDFPCVVDLKMGVHSVEAHEASFFKKAKMAILDIVTRTRFKGVRLEGMSVYRALEHGKINTSKAQSHAISASAHLHLQDVLAFFLTDESGVRKDVAQRFHTHVKALLEHFEKSNSEYLFIGSSILLIYNNDNRAPHSRWARALERATELPPDRILPLRRRTRVDVRMIDFAHTGPMPPGMERDEGYIKGLHSILRALQGILDSGPAATNPVFSLAAAAADAVQKASPPSSVPLV